MMVLPGGHGGEDVLFVVVVVEQPNVEQDRTSTKRCMLEADTRIATEKSSS
jgi:hypothetical protein